MWAIGPLAQFVASPIKYSCINIQDDNVCYVVELYIKPQRAGVL